MTIEERIELIEENRDAAVTGIEMVLDDSYELYEKFFDENGNLNPELTPDEKIENLLKEVKRDTEKYEKLRRKLIDNDFNLSLIEINLIGIVFLHSSLKIKKQIEKLSEAQEKAENLMKKLIDLENKEIDFS